MKTAEETKARVEALKKNLETIENILAKNPEWNKTQKSIAKYVFCVTMMKATDEIVYQIALMASRDIVDELRDLIRLLTESLVGLESQDGK